MNPRFLAVGIALLFLGVAFIVMGSLTSGGVSTGGFILIGPLPIVFGSGSNGQILGLLSIALGLLMILLLYLGLRGLRARR